MFNVRLYAKKSMTEKTTMCYALQYNIRTTSQYHNITMTTMIGILSLFISSRVIHASYSLSYYSNEVTTKILNAGLHSFQDTPSAHHIADIYTRISGLSPIFREGEILHIHLYPSVIFNDRGKF